MHCYPPGVKVATDMSSIFIGWLIEIDGLFSVIPGRTLRLVDAVMMLVNAMSDRYQISLATAYILHHNLYKRTLYNFTK
ncbi:hypothetical protein DK880_00923 [Candidatus Cardinium hertigii]|uniref:Uncharacterized protein n=1 Tax=Candidatus Cardinium hertigii TaxID=247481 RepID=A0A2Z3LJD7_9BACT|nr:hypothetical protein DK880_00859 [Candidatus Cardinium hertigii]AWN82221.1 hypothetical protein DK880_00923 [Candidatus Cardinium hertigii]